MKICVLGLGYIGTVSAGCLVQEGHEVVGVDPESRKVDLINAGKAPILDHARTIVIGNAAAEFRDVPARLGDGQTIIDFVRVSDSRSVSGVYEGICW